MTSKALMAAAVVIALALSPSIAECLKAHQEEDGRRWLLWGWVALVVILALTAGETLLGASS